jgi:DNA-binding response OmpR family regulator
MHVLVIEDDASLLHGIVESLKEEGHEVDCASEGDEGLFLAEQNIYDALILDSMLPGMTGLDILKKLRKQKVLTKVIFLTAKDSVEDRVKGLDYGADDYLVKPFAMAELFARLRVMLRDLQAEEGMISYGPISIREANHEVMINGSVLTLTIKEFSFWNTLFEIKNKFLFEIKFLIGYGDLHPM